MLQRRLISDETSHASDPLCPYYVGIFEATAVSEQRQEEEEAGARVCEQKQEEEVTKHQPHSRNPKRNHTHTQKEKRGSRLGRRGEDERIWAQIQSASKGLFEDATKV